MKLPRRGYATVAPALHHVNNRAENDELSTVLVERNTVHIELTWAMDGVDAPDRAES